MTINSMWTLFENQKRWKGTITRVETTLNTNKTQKGVLIGRKDLLRSTSLDILHVTWDCCNIYCVQNRFFSRRQLLNGKSSAEVL